MTGEGLARGYTDSELDRDRFVQVVVDGEPMSAFRTGDRVRYRPVDGQLEFFGRMDNQVKIRGQRVEPAEVERILIGHSAIKDAVALLKQQGGASARYESRQLYHGRREDDILSSDPKIDRPSNRTFSAGGTRRRGAEDEAARSESGG